jgi:hypothetical protein
MAFTTQLPVRNSTADELVVTVEPSGNQFALAGGEQLEVIVHSHERPPPVEVEWSPHGLIVWAGEGGCWCEVFKAAERIG